MALYFFWAIIYTYLTAGIQMSGVLSQRPNVEFDITGPKAILPLIWLNKDPMQETEFLQMMRY